MDEGKAGSHRRPKFAFAGENFREPIVEQVVEATMETPLTDADADSAEIEVLEKAKAFIDGRLAALYKKGQADEHPHAR